MQLYNYNILIFIKIFITIVQVSHNDIDTTESNTYRNVAESASAQVDYKKGLTFVKNSSEWKKVLSFTPQP